jgi:HPt (histidine-containing phosphotransfer) domain-containing protein
MNAIDPIAFRQLCESTDAGFVNELVETFLDDAPKLIATLRSTAADPDAGAFRRAAHTLKSNSSTFGASALAAIARDLESRGPEAASQLGALEQAYALAARELRALADG